jgi:signal peptidase I
MRGDHTPVDGWWWARQIGSWLVALTALALVLVMVVVPRVAGATPYTVASGSMRPTYQPGTLIVVKPIDIDDIGIGTPITFQLESGTRTVVTHRVVAIKYAANGERQFITRGDANGARDETPVRPVQVRGTVWYDVDHLGYLNSALSGRQHQLLVWIVATALGVYAVVMVGGGLRDRLGQTGGRRRSDRPPPAEMPEPLR